MGEPRQAIFRYLKEVGGVLVDLTAGSASWGVEQAGRYLTFLRRTGFIFLALGASLILALIVGVVIREDWLISGAGLLIGLTTAAFLLLATPLGTLAVVLGREVEPVRAYLKLIGGVLLWALLLTLYFSIVPISNNPKAVFLVVLITFIVALFWALYGISPDPKRIYASVILVFLITTVSFFFPKSFAATLALRGRVDEKLAECLTDPSSCFARQPAQKRIRSIEPPSSPLKPAEPPGTQKKSAEQETPEARQRADEALRQVEAEALRRTQEEERLPENIVAGLEKALRQKGLFEVAVTVDPHRFVTLTGRVDELRDRDLASSIASNYPGVMKVVSQIRVRREEMERAIQGGKFE